MVHENVSQEQILREFFLKHPKKDIAHKDSVGWCMKEYKKRTFFVKPSVIKRLERLKAARRAHRLRNYGK
ncbi:MAG: 30S ribosomal protein S21 [Bacteroidetes bacterium]|nr:30S ribosomal protein S21 [Bacteroidota bacterium]